MDTLSVMYKITQPGYAYLYISNENPVVKDVYFDDVTMSVSGHVLQLNEYYPYGLQTANSWTRSGNTNKYLYNQGSELNSESGLYDLPYRNYDATLGRFFQVDPMAARDHMKSPFVYAGGNPITGNDPSGLMVDYANSMSNPDYVYQKQVDAENRARLYALLSNWSEDAGKPGGGGGSGMGLGRGAGWAPMSLQDFLTSALNNIAWGGYGGSWKNGYAHAFDSNE
jgi:RHS repeat-associated protein